MRLSWKEVRNRAAVFAREWREATYEKGETQSFYNEFFEIFGVRRRTVARYEEHVRKLDDRRGFIDLFWPGVLIVEQKSAGRDLDKAYGQAGEYFDALPERQRPRYILVSDFQTFELHDLGERAVARFDLEDLPANVESFGFILGVERRVFRDQDPANVEAAELVGRVHDALAAAGYAGYDLERFLVRLVFCLFADDTGIFEPRDILFDLLESRTGGDGADFGLWLSQLFQVLNTPAETRQATLDEDLARFPYVNGDLFDGSLTIPSFDASMRRAVLDACGFDWSTISPAIFGALFQSVMAPAERRAQGAHYTTEKNILKVIEPLFLDDLRAEFERLRTRKDGRRRADLLRFQRKLGELTFFDPACGCGNFLIIAYRELRSLELEVLKELYAGPMLETLADRMSVIDVNQFHGIEIGEFPVRIAETALWMMDHIMNNRLSLEFGRTYTRIPLATSPKIVHGDALEMDWADVLPSADCDFVFGNPPFVGAKFQTTEQREQVRRIADLGRSGGTLDYVTAWFLRAGEYVRGAEIPRDPSDGPLDDAPVPDAGARCRPARIGFVATNSITQGEQVAQFWPLIFDRFGLEIAFAHRTFAWGSDARGMAHVHVVIVGLTVAADAPTNRRLFSYPDLKGDAEESVRAAISPYLFDAGGLANPHVVVRQTVRQINGLPRMIIGSKPIDGGRYIFKKKERDAFLAKEPGAEPFLRPYVGSREYLQGGGRYILALHDAQPEVLSGLPHVRERIASVRAYRSASKSKPTRDLGADAQALPCERPSHGAVPRRTQGQFGAPGVRPHRVAQTADGPERSRLRSTGCHQAPLRSPDLRHAHGLAPPDRRPPQERLSLLDRPRVQHLPASAGGTGSPRTADTAGRRRPLGPGRAPRRHAGPALRPRPHAAGPAPRPPGHRPRGRPSLPQASLPDRERAAGAPPRAVRTDADADCRRGRAWIQAPPPANHSALAWIPRRGSSATWRVQVRRAWQRHDSGREAGRWRGRRFTSRDREGGAVGR